MSTSNPSLRGPGVLADRIPGEHIRDTALVVGGAALTGLAAQVSFTVPSITPVPFTLQTAAVLLVGASLGAVRGVLSMALYVLAGLVGVPWFAGHASGFDAARATFGYLVGFVVAAALVGWLSRRGNDRHYLSSTAQLFLGTLVIYACGVPVLMSALDVDLATGLEYGLYPFVLTDTLKVLLAAGVLPLTWRLLDRSGE